ncbi:MAG: sulfatase, partial [Acidobacteriota bacterium]
ISFDDDTLARIEVAVQGSTSRWASFLGGEAENVVRLRGGLRIGEATPEPVAAPVVAAAAERQPDILIYLVDTLRADRLGLYGYDRPTSPRLDAFARDAVTFTEARAQTSWTRTAVVSMFTGLYPPSHGVELRDDGLPAEVVTLAERLKAAGYQTVGMTTNGNVSAQFGLAQGFDIYQHVLESRQRLEVHRLADHVEEWVATWLGGEDLDAPDRPPFLLYAHATDPHSPYTPREPFRSRFAPDADPTLGHLDTVRDIVTGQRPAGEDEARQLSDLYDAEIAFTDHYFGALLDRLRDLGLYDDMIIVFVSDHGEEFFEHEGWEHGRTLYDEQLRVPLVVKLPGGEGGGLRLAGRAGHVDIMPTLLDLLDLPPGDAIDGQSLVPAIRTTAEEQAGGALQLAYLKLEDQRLRSLADGQLKMIEDWFGPDYLFDVAADPTETVDLSAERAIRAGYLKQRLRRLTLDLERDQRQADVVEIDPETREQLEALGYIQ